MILIVVIVFFVLAAGLGAAAYVVYRSKLRRAKSIERGLKMVPLLIHLPPPSQDTVAGGRDVREVMREKTAQAEVLYNLIAGTATDGFKSNFYGQRHVALELVASEGLVHFFAAVPVNMVSIVEKAIMTAYPGARLEEVEDHNIFNQEGRLSATLGGELVLKAEAAYPIATYAGLERDPLEGMLTTLSGMSKTDGAAVQIMLRPAAPGWVRASTKLTAKLRKGRQVGVGFGLHDLAKAAIKAPSSSVPSELPKGATNPSLSQLELGAIEQIEEKTKHPGFEILIRVLVSSDSPQRSQQLIRDIATSFALYERPGLNGFKFIPALDVQGLVTAFIFRFFPPELHGGVLNSQELATLFHLPDSQFTPTTNVERQMSKQVDGPVALPSTGLLLGYNEFRGVRKEIRLAPDDRRRHTYILGQTGTGKSTLLENLAVQDMLSGNGFAFIDPHGDSAEKLLSLVPKARAEDVIYFNPGDTEYPLGLNLFEFERPEQKDFIVQETINMLYKLYDPGHTGIIGPRYEHWYRNAALTLMSDPNGSTFIEIPKVFTDTEYLKTKFKYLKDPTVIDFWTKEMAQTSDYHKSEMLGWFVSKFGAFQNNEMMRNIIGQTKSAFNLRDIMDNKKILIVNLSKGRVGELNSQLLGMIFVIKFQAAAMSRAEVPEAQRTDFSLYVDEFQNFSTDSFASILSEARKYRLNVIVANQFIGQLSNEIRDAVFGNIGTIIGHRMGPEDAEFMTKQFAPVFDSSDLLNLPNFHSAVRLMIGGLPSQPFTMANLPALGTTNAELGLAIKQLSAAKFGLAKPVVEADILARLSGRPVVLPAGNTLLSPEAPARVPAVEQPLASVTEVKPAEIAPLAAAAAVAPVVDETAAPSVVPAPANEATPEPPAVSAPVPAPEPEPTVTPAPAPVAPIIAPDPVDDAPAPERTVMGQPLPEAPAVTPPMPEPAPQPAPEPAPAPVTAAPLPEPQPASEVAAPAPVEAIPQPVEPQPEPAAPAIVSQTAITPPPIGAPPIDLPPLPDVNPAPAPVSQAVAPARLAPVAPSPGTLSIADITGGRTVVDPNAGVPLIPPGAGPSGGGDGPASQTGTLVYDPATDPFADVPLLGTIAPSTGAAGARTAVVAGPAYDPASDPNAGVPLLATDTMPLPQAPVAAPPSPAPVVTQAQPVSAPVRVEPPAAPVDNFGPEPEPLQAAPAPQASNDDALPIHFVDPSLEAVLSRPLDVSAAKTVSEPAKAVPATPQPTNLTPPPIGAPPVDLPSAPTEPAPVAEVVAPPQPPAPAPQPAPVTVPTAPVRVDLAAMPPIGAPPVELPTVVAAPAQAPVAVPAVSEAVQPAAVAPAQPVKPEPAPEPPRAEPPVEPVKVATPEPVKSEPVKPGPAKVVEPASIKPEAPVVTAPVPEPQVAPKPAPPAPVEPVAQAQPSLMKPTEVVAKTEATIDDLLSTSLIRPEHQTRLPEVEEPAAAPAASDSSADGRHWVGSALPQEIDLNGEVVAAPPVPEHSAADPSFTTQHKVIQPLGPAGPSREEHLRELVAEAAAETAAPAPTEATEPTDQPAASKVAEPDTSHDDAKAGSSPAASESGAPALVDKLSNVITSSAKEVAAEVKATIAAAREPAPPSAPALTDDSPMVVPSPTPPEPEPATPVAAPAPVAEEVGLPQAESLAAVDVAKAKAEAVEAPPAAEPTPAIDTNKRHRLDDKQPEAAPADETKPAADAPNQPAQAEALAGKLILPSATKPASTISPVKPKPTKPTKLAKGEVFVDEHGNVTIGE